MTPEELRKVVEEVIREGWQFPWWSYVGVFLISLLGAAAGSYVRKRSEDKAAEQHFGALRDQLKRTTQDTEAIKATLSGAQWLTQQQWIIRERRYSDLLLELSTLQASLEDRLTFFLEPGSEDDPRIPDEPRFQELGKRGATAMDRIREQIGPAAVFLSSGAVAALKEMEERHWHAVHFDSANNEDYVQQASKLVETAIKVVLDEARADLSRPVLQVGSI